MSRYLVTGGAGFIGSHICEELLRRGQWITILDNFSTGHRENLRDLERELRIIKGDLRDVVTVREAMRGSDYVLHQGALPSVPRSVADPIATHQVNTEGTLNVLVAARDAGIKRVVFASSSSVYGDTPLLPKREDMAPNPKSPYAVSKLAGEHYCRVFYEIYGLETVALRYFNVFGPRQDPDSQYAAVIAKFTRALLDGGEITVYGDGEQTRDFTYVANVVEANLLATGAPGAAGKVFNIACGDQVSLNQVIRHLAELVHRESEVVYQPPRAGDVKHSRADIASASSVLGYRVKVAFDEGLARTLRAINAAPE
ncbi:MAG TPA: SDR family oxidoreductase [Armatimonadota bacterium]|nr:SDR family oxidoreductase [Armatimonadota bacterium]